MSKYIDGVYDKVELKAHIDSNENHTIGQILHVESTLTVDGEHPKATVRVISRKAQPGNPMGKWKYLVEYIKGGH